jgi:hypothetical protein
MTRSYTYWLKVSFHKSYTVLVQTQIRPVIFSFPVYLSLSYPHRDMHFLSPVLVYVWFWL